MTSWPKSPMEKALRVAGCAVRLGEVPVGAVIIGPHRQILSVGHNLTRTGCDPTAHAEIVALRRACRLLGKDRLLDCDLYVTLEPCAMCAAAIGYARIRRLYFGAEDPKLGAISSSPAPYFSFTTAAHKPEIYSGLEERACSALLTDFFKALRTGGS